MGYLITYQHPIYRGETELVARGEITFKSAAAVVAAELRKRNIFALACEIKIIDLQKQAKARKQTKGEG